MDLICIGGHVSADYRLFPEGVFEDYDGEKQNGRPNNYDLNRQFPYNFKPGAQSGLFYLVAE